MNPDVQKNRIYVMQMVALLALILGVSATGGIGVVWMRQQISATGHSLRNYERKIAEYERRIQYLDTRIAAEQSPTRLAERAHKLKAGLRYPRESQIVRVGPDYRPLRNKIVDPLKDHTDEGIEPFMVTFELALMDPNGSSPP